MDGDGTAFSFDETEVLAGFAVARVADECPAVVKRGMAGGAKAVAGVADVVERIRRELVVITGIEPKLDGLIIASGFVGG